MKTFVLVLGFCLFTAFVWADVTGEIVSVDIDANNNIRVWTQYKVDGVEIESNYSKIDGKNVFCSRYDAMNFLGMTDTKIKARVVKDVDDHTKTLTINAYKEKATNDIFVNHLGTIVGSKTTVEDVEIGIDTNGDGEKDKNVKIKSDGTSIISPIIP